MNMKLIITSLMIHQNESSKKIMKLFFFFENKEQRTENRTKKGLVK